MPVSNVGAELLINTTTAKSQTDPAVAALNDGGFVAVWTDWSQTGTDSSGSAIRGQLYDASANKVGSEFLVNSKTVDSQYIPSVCSLSSGGFAVSWLDETSVRGQVFGAGGSRVGGEIIIADYGANGGINPFTTNVSRPSPRMTALSGGGFAVTWGLGRDAYGQVYDAAGLKVGAEFSLDSVSGQRSNLGMATLANGRFVVVSTQERSGEPTSFDVRAQIFDANGGKVGAGFQVSTTSGGDLPAVAALSNGNVVVTWSSTSPIGNDTSGSSVHGQMYDAAGAKVGGEFLVNTTTAGSQTRPSVAGGRDGGFVVAWQDDSGVGGDPSGTAVRGQAFSAVGMKLGGEFLVNTTTVDDQQQPVVASLGKGNIVVAWTDRNPIGNDTSRGDIRGQLFSITPTDPGRRLLVHDGTQGQELQMDAYVGPVTWLKNQYIGLSTGEAAIGSDDADFMNLQGGDDAAEGRTGDDVLDGGLGSNFLTGGTDTDTFFVDGRGGGVTWSTVTDFEPGEWTTAWGWKQGTSKLTWAEMQGAEGYKGATAHIDLDANGSIDLSVTFSGKSVGAVSAMPGQVGGETYLAFRLT